MARPLTLILLLINGVLTAASHPFQRTLTSPNGQISVVVSMTDSLRFAVRYAGQELIKPSTLVMTLADRRTLGIGRQPKNSRARTINDSILPPVINRRRVIRGQYIITARNKGTDWFIGGLTNWTARNLTVLLNFLGDGGYTVTVCTDGLNADRNPVDYQFTEQTVMKTDSLKLHVAPGGGFLIRIRKK